MSGTQNIADYYNLHSLEEDARLSPFSLEYLMTMRLIDLYCRDAKTVCDLGGGTGVYAIPLAKTGKKVLLLDISKKEIEIAEQKARWAGVQLKTHHCDCFSDALVNNCTYDLVLCLGPLYHCRNIQDVEMTLDKVASIMKDDDGTAIIAFLSKYSKFNDASRKKILQDNDLTCLCDYYESLMHNDTVFSFQKRSGGIPVSFVEPSLIKAFFVEKGFAVLDVVASDVFGSIESGISLSETNRFLNVAHELGRTIKLNDGNHVLMVVKKSINK